MTDTNSSIDPTGTTDTSTTPTPAELRKAKDAARIAHRREAIRSIMAKHGSHTRQQDVVQHLAAMGIRCSRHAVSIDLRAMDQQEQAERRKKALAEGREVSIYERL